MIEHRRPQKKTAFLMSSLQQVPSRRHPLRQSEGKGFFLFGTTSSFYRTHAAS